MANWLSKIFSKDEPYEIDPNDPHKETRFMEKVVSEAFAEQRRSRRWGIFFKGLTFAYLFFGIGIFFLSSRAIQGPSKAVDHVALVRLTGTIAKGEEASGARINKALRNAFENENSVGVMLLANSGGGSPVQSDYMYSQILKLRAEYPEKKIVTVIEDVCASGCYYVASASETIYGNTNSLVGSIGVIGAGFGFTQAMEKLGIERRLYTSGQDKAFLDPFSPRVERQEQFWESVLSRVHDNFKEAVKQGRGERLTLTDELTGGFIWDGGQAKELGLIDELGDPREVAITVLGSEDLVDYTIKDSPLQSFMKGLGASIGKGIASAVVAAGNAPPELR